MSKKKLVTLCATVAFFASHAAQASPIFCADCSGTSKLGVWGQIQQMADGRITQVADPDNTRGTVTQIQVQQGDNVGGWGGERAERSQMRASATQGLPVLPSTPHEFYALSVKLAPDWKSPEQTERNGMWGIIFQLHGPDRYTKPPAFALCAEDRFHINMLTGDVLDPTNKVIPYDFADGTGALKPGKWVDFVIDVTWSTTSNGSLTIYRRDEGDPTWKTVFQRLGGIKTLQTEGSAPAEAHYWKSGFYRSASSFTSKLWLGPVARATTRAEVEQMAFPNVR